MESAEDVNGSHEPGQTALDISILSVSTVDGRSERPNSFVSSPLLIQTSSTGSGIYRTSSLPGGMNERGKDDVKELNEPAQNSSPVNRRRSSSRSKKKAQYWRNSVAVTNSDYLNQWRPQMMQLIHSQSQGGGAGGLMRAVPSAPSLDTISEHKLVANFQPSSTSTILSPLVTKQQQADPNMFRYTPTPVLDPARQSVPRPLSRPTTPVPPSLASSRATTPAVISPTATSYDPSFSMWRDHSQVIPQSSDVENQFRPVFVNSENGGLYTLEDGYYIPLIPLQLQTLEGSARNAITQPPVPDKRVQTNHKKRDSIDQQGQRYSRLFQDVPDYRRFVQLLMILFAICCDFVVLLIFGLPALLCSNKVKKANRIGDQHTAKKYSEYTLCFSIGGIVFHIILVLIVIMTFLILHFVAGVFGS